MESNRILGFGVFELDLSAGELRKRGARLKVHGRPLQVLAALLEQPGRIVTAEELRRRLWAQDTFVDFQHGLGVALWKLRGALGDSAANPRFIETLPRRGYRFLAPVRELSSPAARLIKKMLAVLPFEDLSGNGADEYLADGLTEELITQLGRLDPARLGVMARASSMYYKGTGRSLPEIAAELRVEFIVSGSIRRSGKRVRITTQLISVADQVQQWAGSYDLALKDVLQVQADVGLQVAQALAPELLPQPAALVPRSRSSNPEAYELYLQGRYHWNKRTNESARTAMEYFHRAVRADPEHAVSYAGLADCYAVLTYYGDLTPSHGYGQAKHYASQALDIDAGLAETHSSLAFCFLQFDWDWVAAESEHLRAIALNPNSAPAHHWYGLDLTQVGRFSEALSSLEHARELDPFSVAVHAHLGRLSYFARDYSRALEQLQRAVTLDCTYLPARYFLAMTLLQLRQVDKAIFELRSLVKESREHPILLSGLAYACHSAGDERGALYAAERLTQISTTGVRVPPFFRAFALANSGELDKVFHFLEDAYVERFGWLLYLGIDPAFDALRDHKQYQDLIRRVNPLRRKAHA